MEFRSIEFAPGAVVAPNVITIPTSAVDIDAVVSAYLIRSSSLVTINNHTGAQVIGTIADHAAAAVAGALGNHSQAEVIAALASHAAVDVAGALAAHAVHAHDIISTGLGGPVANALGLNAGLTVLNDAGAIGNHTIVGGGASGVQNNAAVQAHAAGAAPVAHAAGAAPVAHAAGGAALVHAAGAGTLVHALTGANPIVNVTPTKASARTITLAGGQNTALGDILVLTYIESGMKLKVA